jgi:DNA-binding response OmpR family regulator
MAVILVIDDEQGIREFLDAFLRRKGYDVLLAASGREGLKVFRRERPDVVVLDLNMPGIDGLTVLQEIRNLHPTQSVVILTEAGTAEEEEEQQVRALGVDEYVVKELSLHLLGDSLNRLLIYTDPSE